MISMPRCTTHKRQTGYWYLTHLPTEYLAPRNRQQPAKQQVAYQFLNDVDLDMHTRTGLRANNAHEDIIGAPIIGITGRQKCTKQTKSGTPLPIITRDRDVPVKGTRQGRISQHTVGAIALQK